MAMNSRQLRTGLWLLVLIAPLLCVWLADWGFAIATERGDGWPGEERGVLLFQSAMVAAPFLGLAFAGSSRLSRKTVKYLRPRLGAATGLGSLTTVLLWLIYHWDGYRYWHDGSTGGANIGLGLLMLISPVIVATVMVGGYLWGPLRKSKL